MRPKVSVIILNYNGLRNLGYRGLLTNLSSVLKNDYDNFEVIFVDNGSKDNSVELIRQNFCQETRIKVVENGKNYGFAQGNNLAFRYASGDYIIFLNNDIEVEPNYIDELVKVMESDQTIGLAQSKIFYPDRFRIQTFGNLLDPTLHAYLIGLDQEDRGQFNEVCEITYPCGASFIARRELIKQIGLFDSNYFFYHDDTDLGWRTRLAGRKVVSVPFSIAYHNGELTSNRTFTEKQKMFFLLTCQIGLLIKNVESKNLLPQGGIMLLSLTLDLIDLLYQGNVETPVALIWWFIKNFKYNWKQRQFIQKRIRKVNDKQVFKAFLDQSIFAYRMKQYVTRDKKRYFRDLKTLVSNITYKYYQNHIYVP